MTVLAKILVAALGLIDGMLGLYTYVIFAAVMLSWVNPDPYNPIVRFIRQVTDPVLQPVRRRMWKLTSQMGLDFSPIVVIFGIFAVQIVIKELQRMLLYGV